MATHHSVVSLHFAGLDGMEKGSIEFGPWLPCAAPPQAAPFPLLLTWLALILRAKFPNCPPRHPHLDSCWPLRLGLGSVTLRIY